MRVSDIEDRGFELGKRLHPLLGPGTIHASLIRGGLGISTYPDFCRIELERRTLPDENRRTVEEEFARIVAGAKRKYRDITCSYDVYFYRPALEIDRNEPVVRAVAAARTAALGSPPVYTGMSGWLDSALLAAAGIPTVVFGPTGQGIHGRFEYVDFESVLATAATLEGAILDFCGCRERET